MTSQSGEIISNALDILSQAELPAFFEGTKLYGNVKEDQSALRSDCKVYKMSNETGTGRITAYQVLDGIQLFYNDMHMAYCGQSQVTAKNVIEINHCCIGRYECSFGENSLCYAAAGDLSISSAMKKKSFSSFPLNHYHGITIVITLDELSPEVHRLMGFFGVDLKYIQEYICKANRCCLMRANPSIEHIFSELYHIREQRKLGYMKIKTMELLLFFSDLDKTEEVHQADYYNQNQVKLIKDIAAYITKDLAKHYTIEQLSERFKISATALKKCFRGVYGSSVYAYLRVYRLQAAQKMLMETLLPITTIANKIGYENPNKFSSAFKELYEVKPSDFRKCVRLDREQSVWSGGEN
ncbi:MAG: AraC family transcriptional regulator [Lachnospiraceae bacterium]